MNDVFNDVRFAAAQRQMQAQQAQAQLTANMNADAARAQAEKRSQRGAFTMIPTAAGQTIVRSNQIGYAAPSITTYRSATPNGSGVQQAMSPSMVTPPGVNQPPFQSTSRPFVSNNQNRRII
jgi:hypothetical protein